VIAPAAGSPRNRDASRDVAPDAWRVTTTYEAAVVLGLVLATMGVVASRVDVVLLALPLLLSVAIGVDRRPRVGARGRLWIDVERRDSDSVSDSTRERSSAFEYRLGAEVPTGTELVQLRITPQGAPTYELIVAPTVVASVTGGVPVVHSGRQRVVEVTYRLVGVDGGWLRPPSKTVAVERVVDPALTAIASLPLPQRLVGLTGTHASVRPGDGGEFRDLHPYASGDRLRRIDWKATARRSQGFGDLYVRRTDATSDATIVLVIDSRDDISERIEEWSAASRGGVGMRSMDIAREAAASLAVAAIGAGDRVSLIDLAVHDGVVATGSGKRHLDRLLRRIAASGPSGVRVSRRRAPVVPAGAIVYLLSAFLDDDATSIALLWRAAGHRVMAVDVLPAPLFDGCAPPTRIAHGLVMAERRRRLADARANGVELFRWQEDAANPSRAIALRTLARAGQRRR
jgi:uncharacterized protein (DUF58 family)